MSLMSVYVSCPETKFERRGVVLKAFYISYYVGSDRSLVRIEADSELVALYRFFNSVVAVFNTDEYSSFRFESIT